MGFGDGKGGELGDGEGKEGRKHGITLSSETVEKPFSVVNGWFSGVS
jgi:hypothetical protein